jgi:hypothetical protein
MMATRAGGRCIVVARARRLALEKVEMANPGDDMSQVV